MCLVPTPVRLCHIIQPKVMHKMAYSLLDLSPFWAQLSSSSSSSMGSMRMLFFRQVWRQFTTVRWKCWMLRGSLRTWPSSGYSCREQLASTFTSRLRSSALCWKWTLASGKHTVKLEVKEYKHKNVISGGVVCFVGIRLCSDPELFTEESSKFLPIWIKNRFIFYLLFILRFIDLTEAAIRRGDPSVICVYVTLLLYRLLTGAGGETYFISWRGGRKTV